MASKSSVIFSGAPPAAHAAARALALPARSPSSSSSSIESITRHAVGPDATRPNRSGWSRSTRRSARLSPPSANVTARSTSTQPGSIARRRRTVGAIAADQPSPRPTTSAIPEISRAPA